MGQELEQMLTRRSVFSLGLTWTIASWFAQQASASPGRQGCWLRPAGGSLASIVRNPQWTSGSKEIDLFCSNEAQRLSAEFSVRPMLMYFDDLGSPNALATSTVVEKSHPDGTVLMGVTMAQSLLKRSNKDALELAAVLAHEWGHVVQFKYNFSPDWGVLYELNADSAAGWYLAKTRPRETLLSNAKVVGQYFAALGSNAFNNFESHGSPRQREMEVLAGSGLAKCDSCGNAGYTYPPNGFLEALRLKE